MGTLEITKLCDITKYEHYNEYKFPETTKLVRDLFSINDENFQENLNNIFNFLKEDNSNSTLDWFLNLLSHMSRIRSNNTYLLIHKIIPQLILLFPQVLNVLASSTLLSKRHHFITVFDYVIMYSKLLNNPHVQDKIYKVFFKHWKKSEKHTFYDTVHPPKSLECYILNDDLTNFLDILNKYESTTSETTSLRDYSKRLYFGEIVYTDIPYIDLAAFHGSQKIFSYLILNGYKIDSSTPSYAIQGGNMTIIHLIENRHISFDDMLMEAIFFHRNDVIDYLLSKYKCEPINLSSCIKCFHYDFFLFLLLTNTNRNQIFQGSRIENYLWCSEKEPIYKLCKKAFKKELQTFLICQLIKFKKINYNTLGKKNRNDSSPLSLLCQKKEINEEVIELRLKNGADVNIGYKPSFYYICKHDSYIIIKLMVDKGADVNVLFYGSIKSNKYLLTPLFQACNQDPVNRYIVGLLLENKADANKGDITPLCALCSNLNFQIETINLIREIISNGCDINKGDITPLYKLCGINDIENNIELIKYFIEKGADVNKGLIYKEYKERDVSDYDKPLKYQIIKESTPLYKLCSRSQPSYDLIQLLIDKGANVNRGKYYNYDYLGIPHHITPLGILCSHELINIDLIRLLLENGANPNLGSLKPLYFTCKNKNINLSVLQFLLENGADPNEISYLNINNTKITLTHLAQVCEANVFSFEAFKLLVEYGAKDFLLCASKYLSRNDILNSEKDKMLSYCASKGIDLTKTEEFHQIQMSIDQKKEKDFDYYSLTTAILNQNIEEIRYFLNIGADINDITYRYNNPFVYACVKSSYEIVKFLFESCPNIKEKYKIQGLFAAYKEGKFVIVKYLIENGVSVCSKNEFNQSILHFVGYGLPLYEPHVMRPIYAEHKEVDQKIAVNQIKYLIEKGADVNARDDIGRTPLHMAIIINSPLIFKTLLENGADYKAKTEFGWTPLHYIFFYNIEPTLFNILSEYDHNLDFDCLDSDKCTPTDYITNQDFYSFISQIHPIKNDEKILQNIEKSKDPIFYHHQHTKPKLSFPKKECKHFKYDYGGQFNYKKRTIYKSILKKKPPLFIKIRMMYGAIFKDFKMKTGVIRAVEQKDDDLVKFLIQHPSPTYSDEKESPDLSNASLHIACYFNKFGIVKTLVSDGININYKLDLPLFTGETALHIACYNNNFALVKYLVDNGADINAIDNNNSTPIEYAKDPQIIKFLNDLKAKQ